MHRQGELARHPRGDRRRADVMHFMPAISRGTWWTSLQSRGGLHTMEDFREYRKHLGRPHRHRIPWFYQVHQCPPNGQGVIALLMLNILKGVEPGNGPLDPDRLHFEIEAGRRAYYDRLKYVADPTQVDVPDGLACFPRSVLMSCGPLIEPGKASTDIPLLCWRRKPLHGVHHRRRQGPQRMQPDQYPVLQFRFRPDGPEDGRCVPQSRHGLFARSRTPKLHRPGQATDAHHHSGYGLKGWKDRHVLWRHGWAVPGLRTHAAAFQHVRLWPRYTGGPWTCRDCSPIRKTECWRSKARIPQ